MRKTFRHVFFSLFVHAFLEFTEATTEPEPNVTRLPSNNRIYRTFFFDILGTFKICQFSTKNLHADFWK